MVRREHYSDRGCPAQHSESGCSDVHGFPAHVSYIVRGAARQTKQVGTERNPSTETRHERVDRELIELLNELRVALPGVQVLFAFLLTVPFTQRFGDTTET